MPNDRFLLSDLVRVTGAGRRALQVWADAGLIQSDPDTDRKGSGVHRVFSGAEAAVAALLAPLAELGVTIGGLRAVALQVRPALGLPDVFGRQLHRRGHPDMARIVKRAMAGQGSNYLAFRYFRDGAIVVAPYADIDGNPVAIDPGSGPFDDSLGRGGVVVVLDLTAAFAVLGG